MASAAPGFGLAPRQFGSITAEPARSTVARSPTHLRVFRHADMRMVGHIIQMQQAECVQITHQTAIFGGEDDRTNPRESARNVDGLVEIGG